MQSGMKQIWVLVVCLAVQGIRAEVRPDPAKLESAPDSKEPSGSVEVRLAAGGVLNVRLDKKPFELTTDYGTLSIPAERMRRIAFALRVTPEVQQRIDEEVAKLGSPDFDVRETASAELLKFGEKAIPALEDAAKDDRAEVARRAKEALKTLRETVPHRRWEMLHRDIVVTKRCRITGRLKGDALSVHTVPFGRQELRLADIAEVRFVSANANQQEHDTHSLASPPIGNGDKAADQPGPVDVRFVDGSTLKLTVQDERLELVTPYGKLQIPVGDVVEIDFARRPDERTEAAIAKDIHDLTADSSEVRTTAETMLVQLPADAGPALIVATESSDPRLAQAAGRVLEKLKQRLPPQQSQVWEQQAYDIVHTSDSIFAGRIAAGTLTVSTVQFGRQQLRLADIAGLRTSQAVDPIPKDVLPDPGHLTEYRDKVGQVFVFKVTGDIQGTLWGSGIYTTDSRLATAAVHAGVLKQGESGAVKVKMTGPQVSFKGSTKNGVTSHDYGGYPGSYEILR